MKSFSVLTAGNQFPADEAQRAFFRRLVDDDGIFYGMMQKKSAVHGRHQQAQEGIED
ncbi:MAG: hypothetical protein FJY09_04880 [Chlorobi bacterium]|nr:hypothetical protein [Chlorobiota bacterium]